MVTRCLFGLFVFGTNSEVIYRFLTDDLFEHLKQRFKIRDYNYTDNLTGDNQDNGNNDPLPSVDDAISQHLSILIRIHEQSSSRHDPIQQITLQSGIQVFFDQIAENNIICMTDKSFDTMVILKTINLLKALIKFHIGALPFIHYNTSDQLINRISASLQYFLDNVTTNQALLFESCEYLHINSLIRDQCRETCNIISNDIQNLIKVSRKIILLTCDNKIVHMYLSPGQSRPSNADLFLLLLNNTSRLLRKQFESQANSSNIMAHRFERKKNNHTHSVPNSTRNSFDTGQILSAERANSCPTVSSTELSSSTEKYEKTYQSEVVFLKTSNRVIAPFTLFTIPVTNTISALILVEWENSTICSILYEFIRHLDSYTTHALFPYDKLTPQVKSVESSAAVRRYFEHVAQSPNILTKILSKAHKLHKSASMQTNTDTSEKQRNGLRILGNLTEMSRLSTDAFRHLFFDSDDYARRCSIDGDKDHESDVQMDGIGSTETRFRRNEYDISSIKKILRKKIILRLEDWFSFIEVKSQRNITMNFCHNDFPGLVHFLFVDRLRGHIYTPTLITHLDEYDTINNNLLINNFKNFSEEKILAFELECLSALQHGFTSYTMTDEYFTYNYTLRLQESNGASMRLYKSFVHSQPPSILHFDFYQALADEYYPWISYQSPVACFELISVHLRIVPPSIVREQCEQLWPKLMEPDE